MEMAEERLRAMAVGQAKRFQDDDKVDVECSENKEPGYVSLEGMSSPLDIGMTVGSSVRRRGCDGAKVKDKLSGLGIRLNTENHAARHDEEVKVFDFEYDDDCEYIRHKDGQEDEELPTHARGRGRGRGRDYDGESCSPNPSIYSPEPMDPVSLAHPDIDDLEDDDDDDDEISLPDDFTKSKNAPDDPDESIELLDLSPVSSCPEKLYVGYEDSDDSDDEKEDDGDKSSTSSLIIPDKQEQRESQEKQELREITRNAVPSITQFLSKVYHAQPAFTLGIRGRELKR